MNSRQDREEEKRSQQEKQQTLIADSRAGFEKQATNMEHVHLKETEEEEEHIEAEREECSVEHGEEEHEMEEDDATSLLAEDVGSISSVSSFNFLEIEETKSHIGELNKRLEDVR